MDLFDRWLGHWTVPEVDDFARIVRAHLREAGIACRLEGGVSQLRLQLATGEGSFDIGPVYASYIAAMPWQRRGVLEDFFRSAARGRDQIPTDYLQAAPQLLPVIRDPFLYTALYIEELTEGKEPAQLPVEFISPRHCAALVYDWPEAMCSCDARQLRRWGVDFPTAFEQACENLLARSPAAGLEEVQPGLFCARYQDGYDAARLLLPSLYRELPVKGELIAFTPHRDCLLLTGSEDLEGLQTAVGIVIEQLQAPRRISVVPLVNRHLSWQPWTVPEAHPAAPLIRRQHALELSSCYEEQERLLEHFYHSRDSDMHIAHFNAMQDPEDGRIFSYTVWARGTPTLLPRADEVILVEPPDADGVCEAFVRLRWNDLEELCPQLLDPVFQFPPRFQVQDFPSREAALRERCLALA